MKKLTKKEKQKLFVALAAAGGLFVWITKARAAGKGDVFIGPITVTRAVHTSEDERKMKLVALSNKAKALMAIDLDEMAPTRTPDPTETLMIRSIISELQKGGEAGEASFLDEMLHRAYQLPRAQV
jgi:alpha-D-ribose 1-methylphosphonate 5-triphosphate synthase subunit PhnG